MRRVKRPKTLTVPASASSLSVEEIEMIGWNLKSWAEAIKDADPYIVGGWFKDLVAQVVKAELDE